MTEESTKHDEEKVEEKSTEMFLISDYEVLKKLLKYTSYPSRTFLYQMPDKATSYVNGGIDKATVLMNSILEYHRSDQWRVEGYLHTSNWKYGKDEDTSISLDLVNEKTQKQITISFSGIKEVIVVPDLHSIVVVPTDDNLKDLMPNQVIRFIGLVKQNFLKCLLVGEDDKENEGKRVLSMKFEAVD